MKKHNLSLIYSATIYTPPVFIVVENHVERKGKGRKQGPCSLEDFIIPLERYNVLT